MFLMPRYFATLALLLLAASCDAVTNPELDPSPGEILKNAESLRLNADAVILNNPGLTGQLEANVRFGIHVLTNPAKLEWTVLDPAIATVGSGRVTGIRPGTTHVIVRHKRLADTATVTVADIGVLGESLDDEQFSYIPAGSYTMGGEVYAPKHPVNITKGFMLLKTEVTQAQWESVTGTNPSKDLDCGPLCPVERVSWDDVQGFLEKLNMNSPGRNYRLPTEAEWEYAARAGYVGDEWNPPHLDNLAWWSENSGGSVHSVGEKNPNLWGLHDMLGNVSELLADFYAHSYYSMSPEDDPPGPPDGSAGDGRRVLRGGGWQSPDQHLRYWTRGQIFPFIAGAEIGFRIAADNWTGT